MTQWFGETWRSNICQADNHVPVPLAKPCSFCQERFIESDRGVVINPSVPFHTACFLRTLVGSASHQLRKCSCFQLGSKCGDPEDLTLREAAEVATVMDWFNKLDGSPLAWEITRLTQYWRRWAEARQTVERLREAKSYVGPDSLERLKTTRLLFLALPPAKHIPLIQKWVKAEMVWREIVCDRCQVIPNHEACVEAFRECWEIENTMCSVIGCKE